MIKPQPRKIPSGNAWPPPGQYEYIAIDFDGTLFETDFPTILRPKLHIINWCLLQQQQGAKIILHTCREAEQLDAAIEACKAFGLHFDSINCNPFTEWELTPDSKKPFADIYLDDKAWRV